MDNSLNLELIESWYNSSSGINIESEKAPIFVPIEVTNISQALSDPGFYDDKIAWINLFKLGSDRREISTIKGSFDRELSEKEIDLIKYSVDILSGYNFKRVYVVAEENAEEITRHWGMLTRAIVYTLAHEDINVRAFGIFSVKVFIMKKIMEIKNMQMFKAIEANKRIDALLMEYLGEDNLKRIVNQIPD